MRWEYANEAYSSPPPAKKPTKSKSKPKAKAASKPDPQTKAKPPAKPSTSAPEASSSTPPKPTTSIPASSTNRDATGAQQTYWLFKAEPLPRYENGHNVAFSISDLRACTTPEPWSGVRNYAARNNMLNMRAGDLGFFYHSNAKPSGIVGILRVVEEAKVDESQFDSTDPYYDAKSTREKPRWWCVGVEFVREFSEEGKKGVSLERLKEREELKGCELVSRGRLSVCAIKKEEWNVIMGMVEEGEEGEDVEGKDKMEGEK